MGCKTKGYKFDVCNGFSINSGHCYYYTAPVGEGVTFEFVEYPQAEIRKNGAYNLPDRDENRVMYPYVAESYSATIGPNASNCGKVELTDGCSLNFGGRDDFDQNAIFLDYFPSELSFDYGYSDTWFAYLYDTSNDAGVIGTPCYYIEEEERTTTTTVTPGEGSTTEPSTGDVETGATRCIPCAAFNCTTATTSLRYTAQEDLTGDPDCPHPTLFGFGTSSLKLAFTYDQFSDQLPDGVLDFEVSYDGVTYTDIWDESTLQGISYTSSQNPWQTGEEGFSDFQVYDINDGVNAIDFRLKFRIESIYDEDTSSFTGTSWTVTELLSNGTGFTVNDVYPIEFFHRHPDNSITTFTLNIRIKTVGPIETTVDSPDADLLRPGDTINGHTITRAFHTEVGKFPYHIIYVDGNGNDFVKETQYTSNRNHVITAKAGYGIVDRAILVGLYEFLQKSIQFVTADINQNAPDAFNTVVKPLAFVSIGQNGEITDVNISAGAYSLVASSLNALNSASDLAGYSTGTNISTSGGTGSGLTVDIEVDYGYDDDGNVIKDEITSVIINTSGSGYAVGDVVTISGGSARVRIDEITHGGQNLDKLEGSPQLGISSPNDNDTGLQNKATEDGVAEFILFTDGQDINFEVVSTDDGLPNIEAVSPTTGGNNSLAQIEGTFVSGILTSVKILKKGSGYSTERRPNIIIENLYEEVKEVVPNTAFRDDLVGEFQDIVKSLPEGKIKASQEDLNAIENSYNQVPKTREINEKQPPADIKLDPERERVQQRQQYKLSADATEPLRNIIVPDHDVTYLDNVDVPDDYKKVIRDDLQRSKDTVNKNIDDITQPVIPEYVKFDESFVESCAGSFTNLPEASKFTKYVMRQYRPDPSKSATINVTLSCSPVDVGCEHFSCPPPTPTAGSTTSETTDPDPITGDTTTTDTTLLYTMSPLLGPGCQPWEISGSLKIWHDLGRDAQTVTLAARAFGNPFAD